MWPARGNPSHFVDVTGHHRRRASPRCGSTAPTWTGLGGDFDPDQFLRDIAGYVGLGAGCEYAVGLQALPDGLTPAASERDGVTATPVGSELRSRPV